MLFDTHAHMDDEAFDLDREELLASLRPGYSIVFNGETHLCLKRTKPEEQSTN